MNPILRRSRLLDVVESPQAPILVIRAPSGYGKTTLVRDWQQSSAASATTIWVSLSADSPTQRSFWHHITTTARRQGVLDEPAASAVNAALDTLAEPVKALAPLLEHGRPIVLIIDAYENLNEFSAEIDEQLLHLTGAFPDLRIIVTTRAATTLLDSAHRLRGRVRALSQTELAFTEREIHEFLGLTRTGPTTATSSARAHQATAGYPLAVRAWSLAGELPLASRTNEHDNWGALVAADLRTQLDAETLRVASVTSVPPYFDAALAAELHRALLSREDLDQCLERLERNGYGRWIPFASNRSVFQYVETFRDIIHADLKRTDPARHQRAAAISAAWLHREGQYEEAFALAIGGRDYELASRIYMSVLLSSPESYTTNLLDRELGQVPREILSRFPLLSMARGLALLSNAATRASAGPYFLRTAEQTGIEWRGLDTQTSFFLRVSKSTTLRWVGRYREAAKAARGALDFYRSLDIGDDPTFVELKPIGLRHAAYSFFQAGDFSTAEDTIKDAIDSARVPWSRNYTVVYAVGMSAIEGRVRESEQWAELVDPDAWPSGHAVTYVNGLGRVGTSARALDAFDFRAALDEYIGCESFVDTAEFWPFITWTRLHAMIGLGVAGAEIHRTASALDGHPAPPGTGENLGTTMLRALLAAAAVARGHLAEAHVQLGKASGWEGQLAPVRVLAALRVGDPKDALYLFSTLEDLEGQSARSRTFLVTVGAVAALRSGQNSAARTLLQRAGALYAAHGSRAHLIFLSTDDLAALRELAADCGAQTIAYLAEPLTSVVDESGRAFAPLTNRELEVVRASAEHRGRTRVAASLHVAPETVKSRVKSIYRKWQVNSRDEMISRAIELGVLGKN